MKKYTACVALVVVLMFMAGCSKTNSASAQNTGSSIKTSSQADTSKAANSSSTEIKVTKDNVKSLSDDQLLKMAQEPETNIDNLNIPDEDLSQLDSILNNQDPISDIPKSVDLKK